MPMLKSPDVTVSDRSADLRFYSQEPLDVSGYDMGEMVLLGNLGMNPLCNKMSLYHLDVHARSPLVRMTLHLRDQWHGQEEFIAEMKDKNIPVVQEANPFDKQSESLSVTGHEEDIFAFGESLRNKFARSALEVDELYRPVIHPELLGTVLDDVAELVEAHANKKPSSYHTGAYTRLTHDWTP